MRFFKYHGLGNDYLVVPTEDILTGKHIRRICHRQFGIGADGILIPVKRDDARFAVRIFNPDGSEAEKSGNGLRIFARYLWDRSLVEDQPFKIWTQGGLVEASVLENGRTIQIGLGGAKTTLNSPKLKVKGREFRVAYVDLGNPHCVVLDGEVSRLFATTWGGLIETHPRFPRRTNVQFLQVIDEHNIRIEIWERGAGYTLASGSSACAAVAIAHKLGLCANHVIVHMAGGTLTVTIDAAGRVTLTGEVVKVAEGVISAEIFNPE